MRSRTPRLAGALLATAALLAPAAPAGAAATDAEVLLGSSTSLKVTGHGWGHGHGMSQWGAKGAAAAGASYGTILAFYYPGTRLTSMAGKLKIWITDDTDANTTVRAQRGLKVTDLGNGRSYRLRTTRPAKAWRLREVRGSTRVFYKTARWHLYKTAGRRALAGDGQFVSTTGPLKLWLPSGALAYRGALRLTDGKTLNVLGVEKYLRGVVASEVPAAWPTHALRAQAVAARTYALRERADHASSTYHLCDTSLCQVYGGVAAEEPQTDAAIGATKGQTLTYGGKPAFAQFSSSSGGWTASGSASTPYLIAQPDKYDTAASGDPHLNWTKTASLAPLQRAATAAKLGTLKSVQIVDRDGNATYPNEGWVLSVKLTDVSNKTTTITGATVKSLYGLKSAYFTLSLP